MKEIMIRFERKPELENIEVLIQASERDAAVDGLFERITGRKRKMVTVTSTGGELLRIAADEIISAAVFDKLTLIVTETGSCTVRQSLQSLEQDLEGGRFVRASRHEIVNLDKVRKYDFTLSGTLRLELTGGMETWASRRCIPAIRKLLTERK